MEAIPSQAGGLQHFAAAPQIVTALIPA